MTLQSYAGGGDVGDTVLHLFIFCLLERFNRLTLGGGRGRRHIFS